MDFAPTEEQLRFAASRVTSPIACSRPAPPRATSTAPSR